MKVLNVHERRLDRPSHEVANLLEGMGSRRNLFWPGHTWSPLRLDRGLLVGSRGGHGPIRYRVELATDQHVRFRFEGPRGFDGFHELRIEAHGDHKTLLRHCIDMEVSGPALFTWPLIFRPLHDALIEDMFTGAEVLLGLPPRVQPWSRRVRALRFLLSLGKAPPQSLAPVANPVDPPLSIP